MGNDKLSHVRDAMGAISSAQTSLREAQKPPKQGTFEKLVTIFVGIPAFFFIMVVFGVLGR